jgi:hypothetical protein
MLLGVVRSLCETVPPPHLFDGEPRFIVEQLSQLLSSSALSSWGQLLGAAETNAAVIFGFSSFFRLCGVYLRRNGLWIGNPMD